MSFKQQVLPPLMTVAGFDPSTGAGVTADLQVFSAHRFFGIAAITALTVQSTRGVERVEPVLADVLAETLACLQEDLPPAGVKIGMLGTDENVEVLAEYLGSLPQRPVTVLDPVIRSSSGKPLISEAGVAAIFDELLPLVDWITPNRQELAVLTGLDDVEAGARWLAGRSDGLSVVVTGGDGDQPVDYVFSNGAGNWLKGERVETRSTHGTGCAFSSALLCALVSASTASTQVPDGLEAVRKAKTYVEGALKAALPRGRGKGPMHLLWPLTGSF